MKVAIVLNTSWNIYNFRLNFVRTLLAKGYEVHTVAPHDNYTHYLEELGCTHHDVKMDSRGANPIKDLALMFELWGIYRKVKPDIILHYTIKPNVYGTLAASLVRIPTINNVCGLGTVFLKNNLVSVFAMMLYKLAFRFPRKVFFQNPDDLALFLNKNLISAKSADLIPGSGIDLSHFTPAEFKRNETFTFLLISRLITDKGIMEYVEAVRKLKSKGVAARFQILGAKDPEHARGIKLSIIDDWIKTGTIEYLGTSDDVRNFINQADCVVLPSYREGTPRTLLEAAGSSKPIVATDVPGCHHVVEDNYNGLLCKLKSADDLALKMEQMLTLDNTTLKKFGENGRKKIEFEFDEKVVITKYLQEISQLQPA
ncbi:MAG TPA: glycosyltransferase family 1 protein [Cytophagales bacterium]|nr:glycosyltransferase family 1 protein [Cytophagales bacterium]HRG08924.1 glycosyltransferase family 4 protein [Cyclobacteriaceae bacterium]